MNKRSIEAIKKSMHSDSRVIYTHSELFVDEPHARAATYIVSRAITHTLHAYMRASTGR